MSVTPQDIVYRNYHILVLGNGEVQVQDPKGNAIWQQYALFPTEVGGGLTATINNAKAFIDKEIKNPPTAPKPLTLEEKYEAQQAAYAEERERQNERTQNRLQGT